MKVAKSIEVTLPRTPSLPLLTTYASLTGTALPIHVPNSMKAGNTLAVLPVLEAFLTKFESLERVKIVLVAESKRQIPAYEKFMGLWVLFGERLKLEFKARRVGMPDQRIAPLAAIHRDWWEWKDGWMRYVRGLEGRMVEFEG
jgi:hypothetical protein